jgi:ribosomal protein S13
MLPEKKSIGIALTYVYGVGQPKAKEICTQVVL